MTLPPEAASAAAARRVVADDLRDVDADLLAVAVLLTSELVTNVVLHASTDVTVTVSAGPPVRIEVHDGVAATDAFREIIGRRPSPRPASAPSGRGVGLIHDLASRLGLSDDPDGGKVVWFELDPPDAGPPLT